MTSSPKEALDRRRYIDWARGLAVLIMIEAHTLDAWTRQADRHATPYFRLMMLGGFAAPLFLWLAGLALALAVERQISRHGDRRAAMSAVVKRGLEIFILAFLFRIQAFVVSPGSWPITIFRVDILNVMGPSLAVAGLLWGAAGSRTRAAALAAVVATAIAMTTPLIRTAGWVSALPLWMQWHLRPFGDHTTFTLFPWAGFVFAGVACGAVLASTSTRRAERERLAWLMGAGALVLALGFYTAYQPSIYAASSFWTSSPTYFAIRIGAMLILLGGLYAAAPVIEGLPWLAGVLETFGRNSLFVYWIHVELVYGYTTWPLRQRLPLWGYGLAYILFCVLMLGAISCKTWVVQAWRADRPRKSTPTAVPA